MKRFLAILLSVVMAAGCMSSCSGNAGSSSSASSAASSSSAASQAAASSSQSAVSSKAGEVNNTAYTLTFWHGATDDLRQKMYDAAIARF